MLTRLLILLSLVMPLIAKAQSGWVASRVNLPNVSSAYSIAFGNGRFVITLSGNGPNTPAAAWSTDGESWQPVQLANPSRDFLPQQGTVRFIDGAFYLAGGTSVSRSTDGVTWESIPMGTTLLSLRGIATDGRGMLIGSANLNDQTLLITADRVSWRRTAPLPDSNLGSASPNELAYLGGRYFVSYYVRLTNGGLRPSMAATTNGDTWEPIPQFAPASHLASGNGRMVAYAVNGTSVATTDGRTFTQGTVAPGIMNGGRMAFAGGRFFFIGSLYASFDGLTWAPLASAPVINGQMMDIAYGNGRYIAVGYGTPPGSTALADIVVRLAASAPPVIASGPAPQTVVEGAPLRLSVALLNADTSTGFQWRREGQPIPGATAAVLDIARIGSLDAGRYTVDVRNSLGSVQSDPALVTVVPIAEGGRIINLSVLTSLDAPDDSLTVGFVVGGRGTSGEKTLLVRAGGPSLARFGVDRPNPDPKLALTAPGGRRAENDQWGGSAAITGTSTAVGAFPFLSPDSRDAALVMAVAPGDTTAGISSNNTTGSVIAEVYDATESGAFIATTPRLLNVSVLKPLSADTAISAGFVIGGRTPKTVLVRAVGPSLATFGVQSPLADPRLTLVRTGGAGTVASNDDWAGVTTLRTAMTAVGAFDLPLASKDAALLVTLEPGNYVAEARGSAGSSGSVLVEVYDAP